MKFDTNDTIEIIARTLEREVFHVAQAVDLKCLLNSRVDVFNSISADELVIRLSAYIWAEHLQDEKVTLTAEYPSTWWQHFKHSFFSRRMLRKWPVKMTSVTSEHTFRVVAMFPDYNPPKVCGERLVIRSLAEPEASFRKFIESK